jgi:hypothetical protein
MKLDLTDYKKKSHPTTHSKYYTDQTEYKNASIFLSLRDNTLTVTMTGHCSIGKLILITMPKVKSGTIKEIYC